MKHLNCSLHTLPQTYVFVLLLSLFNITFTSAQSLYELKFENSGITYNCFLVYFDEGDAHMRIGYTANQKYNVVDVKYESTTGVENGYNYFVMMGREPKFITTNDGTQGGYNPDHFVWVWNDQNKGDLPFVTDDPNFSEKSLIRVSLYRELKPKDLTDEFLRQFYWSNEDEFLGFQNIRDNALGNLTQNNNTSNHTNTTSANQNTNYNGASARLHLVLLINSSIGDIGASCEIDNRNITKEFQDIAQALQIDFRKYEVSGSSFTKTNALQVINGLQPDKNDIVVFYYSGHGFRWSDQTDYYPQLDIRASPYTKVSAETTLSLSEVYNKIIAKGARLNLILSDCCNSDIGVNKMTESSFLAGRSYQSPRIEKLKQLFLGHTGNLIITSSSPSEVSWSNNVNGGFFTLSFLQAFHEEISYLKNTDPTWDTILARASANTRKKTDGLCRNCTVQNPVYYNKVVKK